MQIVLVTPVMMCIDYYHTQAGIARSKTSSSLEFRYMLVYRKQDSQFTYNVKLRRVLTTIVAVERQ